MAHLMSVDAVKDSIKTSAPYLLIKRAYQAVSFHGAALAHPQYYWASRQQPTLFFLHIPKAGGTSMRIALEACYGETLTQFYDNDYTVTERHYHQQRIRAHSSTVQVIFGHFSVGLHRPLGLWGHYVTFLREPLSRFISDYHHRHRTATIPDHWTFATYLEQCPYLDNQMVRLLSGYSGPLSDRMTTVAFNTAKQNLCQHFQFVGFFETLHQDWQQLGACLGRELPPLDHANRSTPGKEQRVVLSELPAAVRSRLLQLNQYDLELYQFARDQFPSKGFLQQEPSLNQKDSF